tara:strand:- start:327 stop:773 length:447 start_codon:yes stop_codon:yes gene_type:complete
MEYYEGLLFMTTNRFSHLDTAFSNRIHATIEYKFHDKPARKNIWRQVLQDNIRLLSRPAATTSPESESANQNAQYKLGLNVSDMACDILADLHCNGRNIRNIVRAAISIANSEATVMSPQHVLRVIKSLSTAGNKTEVISRLEVLSEW